MPNGSTAPVRSVVPMSDELFAHYYDLQQHCNNPLLPVWQRSQRQIPLLSFEHQMANAVRDYLALFRDV